jgi:hypothetical protein
MSSCLNTTGWAKVSDLDELEAEVMALRSAADDSLMTEGGQRL